MALSERCCRLCLETENDREFIGILNKKSKTAKRIFKLTGIEVVNHESFPALICDQCHKSLVKADRFRSRCLEAEKIFQAKLKLEEHSSQIDTKPTLNIDKVDVTSSDIQSFGSESTNTSPSATFNNNMKIFAEVLERDPQDRSQQRTRTKTRYKPICGYCGKEQESEYRLRQHELLSHTPLDDLKPNEVFKCDFCSRTFKTKQTIRNHFIVAHTPKSEIFPCSICGKVLPHQKALYAHERVHVKSEFECQYCSKIFTRKVLLSSHIAVVHLKKRLTQCEYCPHQAVTAGALKKHIRCKHLNLRLHHCSWPDCGKSFHENQHLVRHHRSHTQERPFDCRNEGCEKAFSDHAKRSRHEKQNCPRRNVVI